MGLWGCLVLRTLHDLCSAAVEPDIETYHNLMHVCLSAKQYRKGLEVWPPSKSYPPVAEGPWVSPPFLERLGSIMRGSRTSCCGGLGDEEGVRLDTV